MDFSLAFDTSESVTKVYYHARVAKWRKQFKSTFEEHESTRTGIELVEEHR